MSFSSTPLIFSFRNSFCANFPGVNFRCAMLTDSSIDYWDIDLLYACFLCVLWAGASTPFKFLLI